MDEGFGPGADLAFSVLAMTLAMLAALRLTSLSLAGDTDLSFIHSEKVALANAIRAECAAPAIGPTFVPGGLTTISSASCSLKILDNPQFQTLIFNEGVLFPTKKSQLSPGGRLVIQSIRRTPEAQGRNITQVQILGHTDSVGGETENLQLGADRALAVFNVLTERRGVRGVDPLSTLISITTYGYYNPVQRRNREQFSIADLRLANATPEARALNRRIELNLFFRKSPRSN